MSEEIRVAGHRAIIAIEVLSYERPEVMDPDDANWLKCGVSVKAGPFTGAFPCTLTTRDLATLTERLKTALGVPSGKVAFRTTESDISLEILFDNRGTAVVLGSVEPQVSPEASLHFRFETDQSYLTQTLRQLESVLRRFPVKAY